MADILSNGTEVVSGATSATITVDSTDATGTLYAAARTSGAYTAGDEDDIKNGVGADWVSPGVTPSVGTNSFDLTGLDPATSYHCGFAQDYVVPAPTGYEHEFNADLGGFTFARTSSQHEWDSAGLSRVVTAGVPAYRGCAWSGSAFTPDAGYKGLLITLAETCTLYPNTDFINAWAYGDGISVSTTKLVGELEFTKVEFTSTTPSFVSLQKGVEEATDGPWSWVCYVEEGNTAGFTLEVSVDRGTAHFAWSGGDLTLDGVENGCLQMCYQVTDTIWAAGIKVPGVTNQWKDLYFYPSKKGVTPVVGAYTWLHAGMWLEADRYSPNTFNIPSYASTTVAACAVDQTFANMGIADVTNQLTLHLQFYLLDHDIDDSTNNFWLELWGDASNRFRIGNYDTRLRFAITAGGITLSNSIAHAATFAPGVLMDVRVLFDGTKEGSDDSLVTWLSAGTGLAGDRLQRDNGKTFALPLAQAFMGSKITSSAEGHILIKKMKLYPTALTEAEIEAFV